MNAMKYLVAMSLVGASALAGADTYTVDATSNILVGGTAAATLTLNAGEAFSVSVDPLDLWSAGAVPRWSNANGLVSNLFATGSDESGQAAGTLIGQDWGMVTINGFTAPYGALVGQIGNGSLFLVGTQYSGVASSSGILNLYYFDTNGSDNSNSIMATVTAVPEPASAALVLAGLGVVGFVGSRRKR